MVHELQPYSLSDENVMSFFVLTYMYERVEATKQINYEFTLQKTNKKTKKSFR